MVGTIVEITVVEETKLAVIVSKDYDDIAQEYIFIGLMYGESGSSDRGSYVEASDITQLKAVNVAEKFIRTNDEISEQNDFVDDFALFVLSFDLVKVINSKQVFDLLRIENE